MKNSIKISRYSVLKFFKNADIYIGGAIFGVMTALVFIAVVMRYIIKRPIIWSEEAILIMFVWSSYLGITACFRFDCHMRIDFFYDLLPKPLQKVIDIGTDITFLVLFGYLTYLSYVFCINVGSKRTLSLKLSANVFNIVMLISFGIMAVSCIFKLYHKLKGDYMINNPLADVEAENKKMYE